MIRPKNITSFLHEAPFDEVSHNLRLEPMLPHCNPLPSFPVGCTSFPYSSALPLGLSPLNLGVLHKALARHMPHVPAMVAWRANFALARGCAEPPQTHTAGIANRIGRLGIGHCDASPDCVQQVFFISLFCCLWAAQDVYPVYIQGGSTLVGSRPRPNS